MSKKCKRKAAASDMQLAATWEALTKKIPDLNPVTKPKNRKKLRCANCSPQVWEMLTKKIPLTDSIADSKKNFVKNKREKFCQERNAL